MGCLQGQVSGISGNQASITKENETNSDPERKRHCIGKATDAELHFLTLFLHARLRDIPLSEPVLEEKAFNLTRQQDFFLNHSVASSQDGKNKTT